VGRVDPRATKRLDCDLYAVSHETTTAQLSFITRERQHIQLQHEIGVASHICSNSAALELEQHRAAQKRGEHRLADPRNVGRRHAYPGCPGREGSGRAQTIATPQAAQKAQSADESDQAFDGTGALKFAQDSDSG
jgi:hypothetical protein